MIALGLTLAVLAADACPLPAALQPDPATAEAYRDVGDHAREAGDFHQAAIAYREALARTPSDATLEKAYLAACERPTLEGDYDAGVAKMQAGDFAAAAEDFAAFRTVHDTPEARLLEGICRFKLGDEPAARPLLESARGIPELGPSADVFLGLIALHAGEGAEAAEHFGAAQADPSFGPDAAELTRLAERDEPIVASLRVEGTLDSNLALLPAQEPPTGADSGVQLTARVRARPFGRSGVYLEAAGLITRQANLSGLDLAGGTAALGYAFVSDRAAFDLGYGYSFRTLDDSPYLSQHRLAASGAWRSGRFLVQGGYAAAFQRFIPRASGAFTGVLHDGRASLGARLGAFTLLAGYRVGADQVDDPALSYFEHGPTAAIWTSFPGRVRLTLSGQLALRDYSAFDTSLGLTRQDQVWTGRAALAVELGSHWTALLEGYGERSDSNAPDFTYNALGASVGLAYTVGFSP